MQEALTSNGLSPPTALSIRQWFFIKCREGSESREEELEQEPGRGLGTWGRSRSRSQRRCSRTSGGKPGLSPHLTVGQRQPVRVGCCLVFEWTLKTGGEGGEGEPGGGEAKPFIDHYLIFKKELKSHQNIK